ncbi:uncharacterized protein [Macrobrachium rosenbergii]|uniref:uncharacterized protein n=1 Tax=Macrobrachium rosenbergii TaxID=79674 RepID=UPI0034D63210
MGWDFLSLVVVLLSIFLLQGIKKNKPSYLVPFLAGQVIALVCTFIGSVVVAHFIHDIGLIVAELITFLIAEVIQMYFSQVVLTFYEELQEQLAGAREGTGLQQI